jgi:hypothetical protein
MAGSRRRRSSSPTATRATPFPDLFYRVRTALEPIAVTGPTEAVVAFRRPFTLLGQSRGAELSNHGFHGNLDRRTSARAGRRPRARRRHGCSRWKGQHLRHDPGPDRRVQCVLAGVRRRPVRVPRR